jgi:hypothetical protein
MAANPKRKNSGANDWVFVVVFRAEQFCYEVAAFASFDAKEMGHFPIRFGATAASSLA